MTADRLLYRLLQLNAGILLLALPCALLPFAWMDDVHREFFGLGSLPDAPVTKYMARSLCLTYALHGAVVLGATLNWERFRPAVPYLGWLHVAFGCAIVAVGLSAGMPPWWVAGEGTSAGFGLVLLALWRRAKRNP